MSARVVPYRFYRQESTGRTFSLFTSWRPDDCVMVTDGFTIEWPDGTSGTGRKPFATESEAAAYIAARPNFRGMSAMGD